MTTRLVTMDGTASLTAVARRMRDADIGDVIVTNGGKVTGIITDRDIAVRAVAEGIDPDETTLDQMQTHDLVSVNPHDDAVAAADLMRTYAVRRLPVMEHGRLIGVVSLGDLAVEREPDSVLADISADDPNN